MQPALTKRGLDLVVGGIGQPLDRTTGNRHRIELRVPVPKAGEDDAST
jgi:hypothetical protein